MKRVAGCRIAPGQAQSCIRPAGAVAEWLRSGLQSRVHRFDSGPRLQPRPGVPLPIPTRAPTAQPPNFQTPPPAPHRGQIIGQHQQTQGKHPKANDGEKAKDAAKQQQHTDPKTQPARIAAHGMPNSLIIVLRHGLALPNAARSGLAAGNGGKNAGNPPACHESFRPMAALPRI